MTWLVPLCDIYRMRKQTECSACGGEGVVEKAPKFIQILSSPAGMMALAEDGTVWVYCRNPREGWKQLGMAAL